MKTPSKFWKVFTRELGEIRDFLLPFAAKIYGLLMVALVVAGIGIYIAIPVAANPYGLAGSIATTLAGFCYPGSACEFGAIYPPFVAVVVIFTQMMAILFIILHMYVHRYEVSLDDVDTVTGAILDKLTKLDGKLDQDLVLDKQFLEERIDQVNGS